MAGEGRLPARLRERDPQGLVGAPKSRSRSSILPGVETVLAEAMLADLRARAARYVGANARVAPLGKYPVHLHRHTRAARERKCANTASANVVSVALKSTGGSASLLSRVTDVLGGTRKRSVTFSLRLSQAGMLSASMVFP